MRDSYQQRQLSVDEHIKAGDRRFRKSWPLISEYVGGGTNDSIEDLRRENNPWADVLDTECGCDRMHRYGDGIVHHKFWGVRCQETPNKYEEHFRTVTLRLATPWSGSHGVEIHKRIEQIRSGSLYPHITYHGYYRPNDNFLGAYIVDTESLFNLCGELIDGEHLDAYRSDGIPCGHWGLMKNPEDGNTFVYISELLMRSKAVKYLYVDCLEVSVRGWPNRLSNKNPIIHGLDIGLFQVMPGQENIIPC